MEKVVATLALSMPPGKAGRVLTRFGIIPVVTERYIQAKKTPRLAESASFL